MHTCGYLVKAPGGVKCHMIVMCPTDVSTLNIQIKSSLLCGSNNPPPLLTMPLFPPPPIPFSSLSGGRSGREGGRRWGIFTYMPLLPPSLNPPPPPRRIITNQPDCWRGPKALSKTEAKAKRRQTKPVVAKLPLCHRCGRTNHLPADCRYLTATCHTCGNTQHIAHVCRSAKRT